MKSLYIITNGRMGTSYVRVYVWAETSEEALNIAKAQYNKTRKTTEDALGIEKLFDANAETFSTDPSDEGFSHIKIS